MPAIALAVLRSSRPAFQAANAALVAAAAASMRQVAIANQNLVDAMAAVAAAVSHPLAPHVTALLYFTAPSQNGME